MAETTNPAQVLTTVEVAKRFGVKPEKVSAWIKSGQLRAINVATDAGPGRRPRYKITAADLAAFEASRATAPAIRVRPPVTPARSSTTRRRPTAQQFITPDQS